MEVGSPEKEVRGSFRSPREVKIIATSEGLLQSKSTEETCVGASESPRDYVTKEDFQNLATSVLHKLDELKSSTSRSTEAATDTKVQEVLIQHIEALKAHTEALTKVTSAIDSLQTSISSLPSQVYVSDAINSVQVNSSFLDLLKTEHAEIGKEYSRDLAASGYINYNSFKTEIREIVDKAITIGVSPDQGHQKSLATRGDLSNMVAALGEEVRRTSAQFMPISLVYHRRLLMKHSMTSLLLSNPTSPPSLTRMTNPDHSEGEIKRGNLPEAKTSAGVKITEATNTSTAAKPSEQDKGKGKEVVAKVPLTEEEQLKLASKLSRATAALTQVYSSAGRTGMSPT
ncbi:hypothetical protein OSB04_007077 [Centaurea solstitialis]|uniref:Uncharacterized protein n=1 Tax=Centaurea solstitialis TaxID=347529 RepID=A0AA38WIA2_9ASTR|nr:hypothetical protein OSB04_007077 [Centaurea solstitialis]